MTQRTPRTAASGHRAATGAASQTADAARPQATSTQRGPWPPQRLAALLTVVLLTAAGGAAPVLRPAQAGPVVRPDTVVRDPRAWLLLLAGRLQLIAASAADPVGFGSGSYLHVQRSVPAGHGTLVVDSLRWVTPDGGGIVAQTQATVPTKPRASPAPDAQTDELPGRWPVPIVNRYEAGALVSPVGNPVPADADLLANRIAVRTAAMLPPDTQDELDERGRQDALVVAVLADLAGVRSLGLSQRAAVLQVLAGLPTLTTTDTDAAGGSGAVAFRVAAGPAAVTVVVDAVSGRLLRYQTGTGTDRVVLRFDTSRCGCALPETGWSRVPSFWPPVLSQPADTAALGRPAPQPQCPAGSSRVMFLPAQVTASTEALR
ncbi:hypothetical protein GCM10009827_101440 [Dactylosporangium maewongense]|uniref:Uncharacterized protein n=1 Tax=Dactylosporangium maewongense TaxID=634393 RepID=A0ABP4NL45_9ACTN